MWLIATFVINSALSFGLGLVVAAVLGPAEFGRYAIAAATALIASTCVFDWLRLSATRFYGPQSGADVRSIRASLDRGYVGAALLVALLATAPLPWAGGAGMLAAGALVAVTTGAFEYAAALSRAEFRNGVYARLVILKNALALAAMAAAGWWLGRAEWVLAAFGLGTALATLSTVASLRVGPAAAPSAGPAAAGSHRGRLAGFARYGAPIVAANLAYQGIALLNRVVAAATLGDAASGQLSLATDVTIRLFVSVGAALDVYLFQLAVRRGGGEGEAAAHAQVARNMVLVLAALALGGVGLLGTLPAFTAFLVPVRFAADFAALATVLIPGVLAYCAVQFALSPVFQIAGRTGPILVAALAALAADAALVALVPGPASLLRLATCHAASLGAGAVVAAVLAWRVPACRPRLRDLGAIALAAGCAALAIWPTRAIPGPAVSLAAAALAGSAAFGAVLLALDLAGARATALRVYGRLGPSGPRDTPPVGRHCKQA